MATTLITDHASLKTVVAAWLNRDDIDDEIGNMIQNAESELRRDWRCRRLARERYEIIQDLQPAPATYKELHSWEYEGPTWHGKIVTVPANMIGELRGRYGDEGVPRYAVAIDGVFRFAPAPDVDDAESADGTLTFTANPLATETVVIGSKTYTFVSGAPASANDVHIGSTQAASIANLVAAINDAGGGGDETYHDDTTEHPDVYAEDEGDGTVTVTARVPGDAGNAIATTETLSSGSWGAATLTGGVSPANAYATEMTFWRTLPDLSAGANWLVQDHPDIYLYATLLESAEFLKEDERVPVWQNKLDRKLEQLNMEVERELYGGSLVRQFEPIGG